MSRIRLEWVPIPAYGLGVIGFDHLHIAYEYAGATTQDQWYVIEGTFGNGWTPLLHASGEDGMTTLAEANPTNQAPSYGQALIDKIGTPYTRGSRGLPVIDTLSTWESMAAYAADFDGEFQYSVLGIPSTARPTSNSTSMVASILFHVGIDITNHIPFNMRRTSGMHTLLGTREDDEMTTDENFTTLQTGRGRDVLSGTDRNERFYGGLGDDLIMWNKGYNLIHGGQWLMPYAIDGVDTVDYSGGGAIIIQKSLISFPHVAPDYVVRVSGGAVDHLYSIERIQWSAGSDRLYLEDVEVLEDGLLFKMGAESSAQGDRLEFAALEQGLLIAPTAVEGQLMLQANATGNPGKASWSESVEYLVGSGFDDRIYLDTNVRVVEGGGGDDLIDARLATAFEGVSPQGYDAELIGDAGDDTLVSNAGRTLMTGGAGADTFVISATTTAGGTVEHVITGADSSDRLYIPYSFFNGSNGTFDGSQLMPVLGGIGEPGQVGQGQRAYFDWLTEANYWYGTDMSLGVITFIGAIEFDYAGSDLLIHIFRGVTAPFSNGNGGTIYEVLKLPATETIVRVVDFQEGELGIDFYDPGTPVSQQLPNGQWVLHYPNHDAIVHTITADGSRLAALDARPTALEMPGAPPPPPPPLLGGIGDDTIALVGSDAVVVQAGDGNDSVTTGGGNDSIDGGAGNDSIDAGAGNDTLDGGLGNDSMAGGLGDDAYVVDSASDLVVEAVGAGTDTAYTAISLTLPGNVENLILGEAAASGTGNALANRIAGEGGANLLTGLGGDDTLFGSAGNDTMIGGAGNDQYAYMLGDGRDVISDQGLAGDVDVLIINHGILPSEVSFVRPLAGPAQDLLLLLPEGGRILLQGFSGAAANSIEQIWFGDGTRWLRPALDALAAAAPLETNSAPVAVDDTQLGLTLASVTIAQSVLLGNDYDVNGDTLTIISVGGAVSCVVTLLVNGEIQIDSPTGFQGLASFSYMVSDGQGGTATAIAELAIGLGGQLDTLTGTAGNDSILGQPTDETLLGMAGDDTLDGGGGVDVFDGGSGFDWVSYASAGPSGARLTLDNGYPGTGEAAGDSFFGIEGVIGSAYADGIESSDVSSWLKGEGGQDDLFGGAGNDTIDGGAAMDNIHGDSGNDTLIGGDDLDSLYGNDGNDLLDGATGETLPHRDELVGGAGDDTYIVFGDDDLLELAGQGNDVLLARSSFQLAAGVSIETMRADSATIVTLAGNDLGQVLANDAAGSATLVGGGGSDTVNGGAADELLYGDFAGATGPGTAAADLIQAGGGNDTAFGEAGNDTLQGGDGNDLLDGGLASDSLDGGIGDDTLSGNDASDTLQGGDGHDQLDGAAGETTPAVDMLIGGLGDDTYVVLGDDSIVELAGQGSDTLRARSSFQLAAGISIETLRADSAAAIALTGNELGQVLANDVASSTTLVGGGGSDTIQGGAAGELLHGDFAGGTGAGVAAADLILTGDGNDTAYGEAGNDTLQGAGGNDSLYGGLDNDSLDGGLGADSLSGDIGLDTLIGGDGNDTLLGGDGNDLLSGNVGTDQLSGQLGDDTLYGGASDDTIDGGDGNDIAYGDDGNDAILGGIGNDTLSGLAGNDSLNGQAGDDVLLGGTGADTLVGGLGADSLAGDADADRLDGVTDETTVATDTLTGGLGNDTYLVNGTDVVTELATGGTDQVLARSNYVLTAAAEIEQLVADAANITVTGNEFSQALSTTLTTVARLRGGGGNDTVTGSSAGNDVLYGDFAGGTGPGAAGNDSILGGGGNDSLYGENGNDILLGQDGNDRLQGGNGNDSADGGLGNDLVYGDANDDTLLGQAGNDTLYGGANNDLLNGGDGLDALRGEAGNDALTGGTGTDSFIFSSGFGRDTITDLAAGDLINLQAFATTYASLAFTNVGTTVEIRSASFGASTNVIVVNGYSGPIDQSYFLL